MKFYRQIFCSFLVLAMLLATSNVHAEGESISKAIFVRIFFDDTFANYQWSLGVHPDDAAERIFKEVKQAYRSGGLMNVELIIHPDNIANSRRERWNNDFMWTYHDQDSGTAAGILRLQQKMRDTLPPTRPLEIRRGSRTYQVGPTVNWVFLHKRIGVSDAGRAQAVGALGTNDAMLYVTSQGPSSAAVTNCQPQQSAPPICTTTPADDGVATHNEVVTTTIHEMGHLLGGRHDLAQTKRFPHTIMSDKGANRSLSFSPANKTEVSRKKTSTLHPCNNFQSRGSCENYVNNEICGNILDYTQIASCQSFNIEVLCGNICTSSSRTIRDIINGLDVL